MLFAVWVGVADMYVPASYLPIKFRVHLICLEYAQRICFAAFIVWLEQAGFCDSGNSYYDAKPVCIVFLGCFFVSFNSLLRSMPLVFVFMGLTVSLFLIPYSFCWHYAWIESMLQLSACKI